VPRPLPLLLALVAALCISPVAAAADCETSQYSYAGLASPRTGHGVAARLTALAAPTVEDGHVAAWVGVGGVGLGPGGTNEWIQVGLSSFPGAGVSLYYEVARPGQWPEYVEVEPDVDLAAEHRVAVVEIGGRKNWWRVWANGRAVSEPIHLPESHGAWQPIATGESWSGGRAVCNAYAFRFRRVRVSIRPGGIWRSLDKSWVLEDPGYRVVRSAPAAFVARADTD
jgi:hypothetical protein